MAAQRPLKHPGNDGRNAGFRRWKTNPAPRNAHSSLDLRERKKFHDEEPGAAQPQPNFEKQLTPKDPERQSRNQAGMISRKGAKTRRKETFSELCALASWRETIRVRKNLRKPRKFAGIVVRRPRRL